MATAKQKIFINEYLKTWNATEAARRAKYANPNVAGSRLLVNDSIKAIIDERLEALKMDADRVIIQISELADGVDLTQYIIKKDKYNSKGDFIGVFLDFDFEKLQEDGKSHLIKGIKQDTAGNIQVEFYDRAPALVNIAKYHGLFTQKVDITSGGQNLGETVIAALDQVYGTGDDDPDD